MSTRWWQSHSVRVRLTLWCVGAMVVVLGVYVAAVYAFVGRNASEALDRQLRQDFTWVYASLSEDRGRHADRRARYIDPDFPLPWIQVWRGDRSRVVYRNTEAELLPIPESRAVDEGIATIARDDGNMRILTEQGALRGPFAASRIVIQVGRSEDSMKAQMRDAVMLVLGLPVAVAVAGIGGYALARRALAPIERMTEHARTITAERLRSAAGGESTDEMGRLAAVFNATLRRLEQSFEQMRRFTADVSHQLRTPLTAIRSVGEVGLRTGHREESSRAIIGSMLEETDRLAVLVDRLLTLSRAEMGQGTFARDTVNLTELAEDVVGHLGAGGRGAVVDR